MNLCTKFGGLLVTLACVFGLAACFETDIVDDISTELTFVEVGEPGEAYEVRKRFRFTHDPAEAAGLYLFDSLLGILEPVDADLSFIHQLNVYVVDALEQRTLVGVAQGFVLARQRGASRSSTRTTCVASRARTRGSSSSSRSSPRTGTETCRRMASRCW